MSIRGYFRYNIPMEKLRELTTRIIEKLAEENKSVTFAESCTGGRIAAEFTAVSGASRVLNGSVVAYANEIKRRWLGVSEETLEKEGAVSEACVRQMLDGILRMSGADYAIAVSGIAGPTGGTPLKPVGTVYIGIKGPAFVEIYHCLFQGDRESVQIQSVRFAVEKLAELINF